MNRGTALHLYQGQVKATRDYAAGRLSTDEFADAFWHASNQEIGPDKLESHSLDLIFGPVSELLMGYEDAIPPTSPDEIMEGVRLALRKYETWVAALT